MFNLLAWDLGFIAVSENIGDIITECVEIAFPILLKSGIVKYIFCKYFYGLLQCIACFFHIQRSVKTTTPVQTSLIVMFFVIPAFSVISRTIKISTRSQSMRMFKISAYVQSYWKNSFAYFYSLKAFVFIISWISFCVKKTDSNVNLTFPTSCFCPKFSAYKTRIPSHNNIRTQEAYTRSFDRNEKIKAKI